MSGDRAGTERGQRHRDWKEGLQGKGPHLEDLKAGDIQDAQEGGTLPWASVQGAVEPQNQPAEEALVGSFGQSLQGEVSLQGKMHSKAQPM